MQRALATGIFILSAIIGIAVFLFPVILPTSALITGSLPGKFQQTQVLTMVLLILTISVLILEVQGQTTSAKMVAAMGLLVAATSV